MFCFCVGLVKDVFSNEKIEFKASKYDCSTSTNRYLASDDITYVDYGTHAYLLIGPTVTNLDYPISYRCSYTIHGMYKLPSGMCQWMQHIQPKIAVVTWTNKDFGDPPETAIVFDCPSACNQEKAAKAVECGSEENIINWDDETCNGECKPCTGEGQDTPEEATAYGGLAFYNAEECYGVCRMDGPPCDQNNKCCEKQ